MDQGIFPLQTLEADPKIDNRSSAHGEQTSSRQWAGWVYRKDAFGQR